MVSKNQQKLKETNGMPSLPIVPTQVTLKGNVLGRPNYSHLALGCRVMN